MGRICMRQGLHSRAYDHFRRALALSGRSAEACLAMADFQRGRANFRAAERWLCAARKGANDPEVDFKLGWLYGQQGDFDGMRRSFKRFLLKAGPTGDPLTRFLALMGLDDYQGAFGAAESFLDHPQQAELERFLRLWPEHWLRAHDKAFYRSKRDALNAWQRENPASPWPGFIKGATCWRSYLLDEALQETRDLARLPEPRYGWMRYLPGLVNIMMRRHAEARADLEAAVRSAGGFWQARCRLAESLLCLGENRAAWGQFALAETKESQSEVWGWRGEALLWSGEYVEALHWLNRAIGAGSWLAVCWRAGAQMLLGNHEAALGDLDRAIVSGSMDAEAYTWRGELHRRMGHLTQARLDLQRADAISEGEWIFVNLGLLCLAEGDACGMRRQFGRMDAEVVRHIEGEMGLRSADARTDVEIQCILETGLKLARGVRRHESYLRDVWMSKGSPRVRGPLSRTQDRP
jgi:tetratricopeptide (TPR) repeat protein